MSLATSIKDFSDLLTEIYTAKGLTGEFPVVLLLQHTIVYIVKSFASSLIYLFSFQWLRDISYLPLLTPQIDQRSLFGDNLSNNPAGYIFSFSGVPEVGKDQLFAGVVNSLFFSLPVSLPHLVSLRRLFAQGPAAAAASVAGLVAANSLFLAGTVYGLRFLIIPYLSLEPFNYIAGVLLVALLVKSFSEQRGFRLVSTQDTTALLKIGTLTFLLTLCEQPTLFHSFNNLTLNAQNSCFDLYPCASALNSFLVHTTYILAFVVGHAVFSALFYALILILSRSLSSLGFFTTAKVTVRMSQFTLYLTVALTVASFPYYGLDYLITHAAGFLPEDPAYKNSMFSPTQVNTKYPHFFKEVVPRERDLKTPLNLDLNYFDRGLYLNAPRIDNEKYVQGQSKPGKKQRNENIDVSHRTKSQEKASQRTARRLSQSKIAVSKEVDFDPIPALSFEELNYQGEYAWLSRKQLSTDVSRVQQSLLTPLFKNARQRYANLRKLYQKKIEDQAHVAHNKTSPGSATENKDGVLPGEDASHFVQQKDSFDSVSNLSPGARDINLSLDQSGSRANNPTKGELENRIEINPIKRELDFERKVQKRYSKGFVPPFSLPYEKTRYGDAQKQFLPIKTAIKKRYFLNNVYKSLLQIDIDLFLARQPAAYKIAENQEFQLYQKRQILQKYYNWLRSYQPLEEMMRLHLRVPNTKSFVDRVYHQQFKGTLKIAKRLFKVTFDSQQNSEKRRVLSYDQLLYNDLLPRENPYLHEELLGLQTDRSGQRSVDQCFSCQPFLEESNSSPTYAGWDPISRRFVVTNRFVLKRAQ